MSDQPDDTRPDLYWLDTDDLITELLSRFEHAIFSGMKPPMPSGHTFTVRRWKGNSATCCGLAAFVSTRIIDDYYIDSQVVDDDEPPHDELRNDE